MLQRFIAHKAFLNLSPIQMRICLASRITPSYAAPIPGFNCELDTTIPQIGRLEEDFRHQAGESVQIPWREKLGESGRI